MKSLTKILSTSLLLTAALSQFDQADAASSTNPATLAVTTLSQELALSGQLASSHKVMASDFATVTNVSSQASSTYLDNAYLSNTLATTGSVTPFAVDSGNLVNLFCSNGTAWESYQSSSAIPASSSATFTIACPQTFLDGVATTTNTVNIVFTAGSGAGALLQATVAAYLNAATAPGALSTNSASYTAITGNASAPLPTGWTAKVYVVNGSNAAIARTLGASSIGLTWPVTISGATTPTAFTTSLNLAKIQSFNTVTTASTTTTTNITFSNGGDSFTLAVKPASLVRTSDIVTSLLAMINGSSGIPSQRRLNQSQTAFVPTITEGMSTARGKLGMASGSQTIEQWVDARVDAAIKKAGTTQTKLNTAGATTVQTDYNFVTTAPSAITISSIDLDEVPSGFSPSLSAGTYVRIKGVVGSGGTASTTKTFYSPQLEGLGTPGKWTPTINAVMKYTALDGDSLWAVMFNTSTSNTGLDFSTNHSALTQSLGLGAAIVDLFTTSTGSGGLGLTTIPSVSGAALLDAL